MIRWSYVAPRLLLVAALMLFLGLGLDPIIRWSLIVGGQAMTGAKVNVGQVSTSIGRTQIALADLQVANPYAPDADLVQADYAWLDIESGPLTRRRFIIREGVVHGLKINAARHDSGLLGAAAASADESQFREAAKDWLKDAAGALGKDLEDDLETVKVAREMKDRWPQEYKQLEARIDTWLEEVKALEQLPDELRGDILAQAEQVRRAGLTLKALKEELIALRAEFQRLHQHARIDRSSLSEASKRDVEKIKERLQLARLDPETWTDYLLGPELGPQTREAISWVQWARRQIPSSDMPQPKRTRGVDIALASYHPEPWLLVRSLRADGEIHWRGKPVPFAAMANDWTAEPHVHGHPATIRLKTTVPVESWIELTVDRTGVRPADRLIFVCPRFPVGEQSWGDDDSLCLHVPGGDVQVRAAFLVVDEQLHGTILLERSDVAMRLALDEDLGGDAMAGRIQTQLDGVQQVDAVVTISGTLLRPKTSITSPLGGQLRDAMRAAVSEEIAVRREQLEAKVQSAVNAELDELQTELATRKAEVMKKLALADEQQEWAEKFVARHLGIPKGQFGRKLIQAIKQR